MRPCFRFSVKCGEQSQCSFKLPLSDSFQVFQEKQRGKKKVGQLEMSDHRAF